MTELRRPAAASECRAGNSARHDCQARRVMDSMPAMRCLAAGAMLVVLGLVVAVPIRSADAQIRTPRTGADDRRDDRWRVIAPRIRDRAIRQIQLLRREKESWTPAQRRIHPKLLLEYKRRKGMRSLAPRMPPDARIRIEADGTTLVDIKAEVTPEVLRRIEDLGGTVINSHPRFRAIRARIPLDRLEEMATTSGVRLISPAAKPILRKTNTSQGDVAHRANLVRSNFAINGGGVKQCAISDSIEALAGLQSSGDLPATVEVLSGQSGSGSSEGTALLEIMFDLAPGATLGYATALGGQAQFAQNIINLRAAGCDVLVDDIFYFAEPVYQDGPIAQAVDQVTADGALYFSSAGNAGNLNDGTSGVWEGDYLNFPQTFCIDTTGDGVANECTDQLHDFGSGGFQRVGNRITSDPPFAIVLQWSDPQGGSGNDYDLYLFDPSGTTMFDFSILTQDGDDDPIEGIDSGPFNDTNNILVIDKVSGSPRHLSLNTLRGRLSVATAGQISGHTGARSAIAVAAVDQALAGSPFDGDETVETFSSDGPRRVFFEANGSAITPGNFLATGGELRLKPELAGADGVATATPGFNPFFGTSAAAPHAAAIAALLLSASSQPTPAVVRQAMFDTALDIEATGFDRDSGHGIVDALAAIQSFARPDLVALWGKLKPGCLVASETNCRIKGEVFVQNKGNADSVLSRLQFYHSTDGTLQRTTDTKIFTTSPETRPLIPVLTPNQFVRLKVKVPLPGVTDTANDSVFAYADDGAANAESDETNNADRVTFTGPFVPSTTTWDPATAGGSITLSNGNLTVTDPVNEHASVRGSDGFSAGKKYFEFTVDTVGSVHYMGVGNSGLVVGGSAAANDADGWLINVQSGNKTNGNGEAGISYGTAFSNGDVGMCAVDFDNGRIWWGRNGVWFNSGDPAAGTNAAFTNIAGTLFPAWGISGNTTSRITANFGGTAFTHTLPAGFTGWN